MIAKHGQEAAAAYKAWRPTVDFTGPIDSETTALLPQLHQTLVTLGIDDPLLGIFAGISRRAWYENQLLLASLRPVLDHLAADHIEFVLVGEVPLVLSHFESLHSRRIEQIDIVVSPRKASRTAQLLSEAGWLPDRSLSQEQIAYGHVKRFTGPNARVLDLHWHFIGSAATPTVDEFFWASRQAFDMQGASAGHLAPATALLHSLLDDHSLLAAMPARWAADELALIAGTAGNIHWDGIADFAIANKLASRLRRKLELLMLCHAPIPDATLKRLSDAKGGIAEAADRLVLNSLPRSRKYMPIGARGVFADYLRSGQPRGLSHFSHFVRHRWGLKGRRGIPAAAARGIWRSLVSLR